MIELPDRAARERLAPLFGASRDILLTACLQGYAGRAAISQSGRSAALLTGDFAFLAGEPDIAALRWLSENKPGELIISGASGWLSLAQSMGRAWEKSIRYAFDTPESWDIARLTALTQALPAGFTLHPMDGALYARCRETAQLRDLCGCDGDEAAFFAHGLGVVALHGQELAGGASAYAWDDAGIEVEIDTLPPFRRQGVATACGAALILRCLAAHRRVHWDAANPISARLAERLGFLPRGEYAVIEWR